MLTSAEVASDHSDPLIGTTLSGRYRVLRLIGEGGMGRVYVAEHLLIERQVAVKVLREDYCRRADVVERFRREAKSASRIGHPNIVDVLDFGETGGGASYFVMEMLQGQELAQVIANQGVLTPTRAVSIAYQCCHALGVAHDKGIVHRDMKPENILLIERDGFPDFVKIVDFGVAKMSDPEFDGGEHARVKLTRTGMIFGTPEYMSPEQAVGLPPDFRVDIYAMGITLYELLTGRVPFEGNTFMAVLAKHANKPVPALSVMNPLLRISPELLAIVHRALRKEPSERFADMREMAQALEQVPEMPPLPFRLSLPLGQRLSRPSPIHPMESPLPVVSDTAVTLPIAPLRKRLWSGVVALTLAAALSGVYYAVTRPKPVTPARAVIAQPIHISSTVPAQAPAHVPVPDRVSIRVTTEPSGARATPRKRARSQRLAHARDELKVPAIFRSQ